MERFFKEKALSLGVMVVLLLVVVLATYFITSSTIHALDSDDPTLPTLPPIQTEGPGDFTDTELFLYACVDAFDPHSEEIFPLLTLSDEVQMLAFKQDGIVHCYSLAEVKQKGAADKRHLFSLLGLSPDFAGSQMILFDIPAAKVFRPAYETNCQEDTMSLSQCTLTADQQAFMNALLLDAADKKLAYTRLGYTYNYLNTNIYGVSEFAADPADGTLVRELTLDECLTLLNKK